ncbi:exosc8 protein [Hesseltinella vesiculosa]|uniref:Ribosomal RNA-processing protein 43 n=1 Tax=Hesseltinella vesiculosa TaxID=101127 RepID=A0A1X2G4G4_9FUNG|nr:exosc8 protein [Hesseltinella vesiculosa]
MESLKNSDIFNRIQPHEYMRRFIDQKVRPDGRLLDRFRETLITSNVISTANASAMVRLGGTTVVCGIKAEVGEPSIDTPDQGYLVPNVILSPLCSSQFRPGPPSEQAQIISEFLSQLFTRQPHLIPLESLCIESANAVWVLHADIVCLNYDGNMLDASLLALTQALCQLRLPKAEVNEGVVVADKDDTFQPFEMTRFPIAATYCVFAPDAILSDPNDAEEQLTKETLTVVMDSDGDLLHVHKNGGAVMDMEKMRLCLHRTRERLAQLKPLIQ